MSDGVEILATLRGKDELSAPIHSAIKTVKQLGDDAAHHSGRFGASFGAMKSAAGSLVDGIGKLGLAMNTVGMISGAVGGAIKDLAADYIEAEKVTAQLNAVLASTGGVSGMTAQSVNALSNSLSKVTPFEDELITKTSSMLLTFTNIGKDVFPMAAEAALNMATALGEDPVNAAMRLGKALNDPVAGVTALRRVGVQLTDEQKDLIKSLMDVGDVAGAQAIILKELETEFGNSARAAGETFAGKLVILETQVGNVKEAIGAAFIPVLSDLLSQVIPVIAEIGENLPAAFEKLGELMAPVTDFIQTELVPRLASLGEIAKTALTGDFGNAADGLKDLLIADVFPSVMDGLGKLGGMLVTWVTDNAGPMLVKLGELGRDVLTWLGDQVEPMKNQLGEWAARFRDWVGPAAQELLTRLGGLAVDVMDWIEKKGPGFLKQLTSEWIPAFLGWVAQLAIDIAPKLGEFADSVRLWIKDVGAPAFGRMAVALGTALIEGVVLGLVQAKDAIGNKLGELATGAIAAAKGKIEASSPSRLAAREIGSPLITGIIQGIVDTAPSLGAALERVLGTAVREAAPSRGHSPASAALAYVRQGLTDLTSESALATESLGTTRRMVQLAAVDLKYMGDQIKFSTDQVAASDAVWVQYQTRLGGVKADLGKLTQEATIAAAAIAAVPGSGGYIGAQPGTGGSTRMGGTGDSAVAGRRAGGGPTLAGSTYLIGERGPELLHMGGDGYVTPGGGRGGEVTLSPQSIQALAAALRAQPMTAVIGQQHFESATQAARMGLAQRGVRE